MYKAIMALLLVLAVQVPGCSDRKEAPAFKEPVITIASKEHTGTIGEPPSSIVRRSRGPSMETPGVEYQEDQELTFYRVTTTLSEIYISAYVEKLKIGESGCCERRVYLKKLSTLELVDRFQLIGEFTDFTVRGWASPASFVASSMGKRFLFSDLDNERVTVTEITEDDGAEMVLKNPDDEVINHGNSRSRVKNAITEIPK